MYRLGNVRAKFSHLVIGSPQRSPDGHGSQLSAGVLERPWLAGHSVVLLRKSGIEDAAEVHVTGRAASRYDDSLLGANIQLASFVLDRDAERPARGWLSRMMPVILCSRRMGMPKFRAQTSSGRIRPIPKEVVAARAGSTGLPSVTCAHRHGSAVHLPRNGVSHRSSTPLIRGFVNKDDSVGDKPIEGRNIVVEQRRE